MKLLTFVVVFLVGFLVVGVAVFWQDDSGKSLIDRIGQSGDGQNSQGQQQVGSIDTGQSDSSGSGGQYAGSDLSQPHVPFATTGYIINYDLIGQTTLETDLSLNTFSTSYNWRSPNNADIILQLKIENNGLATISPSTVKVDFSGGESKEVELPILEAYSYKILEIPYDGVEQGAYNLKISIDYRNLIAESSEDNNVIDVEVFV